MGRKIGIKLIQYYQRLSKFLPGVCRYTPTCSEYTKLAIEKYGLLKGSWMGTKRICRCHPWNKGGHDPLT